MAGMRELHIDRARPLWLRLNMTLREWRRLNGLSLGECSAKLGITKMSLSRYERGRVPTPVYMRRIIAGTGGQVTANAWFLEDKAA